MSIGLYAALPFTVNPWLAPSGYVTRPLTMQWFQAPAANAPPDRLRNGVQRLVNGDMQSRVSPRDDDTGQPTQDNLHTAFLVDPAPRPVDIPCADSHPLDRPGELSQLPPQLPPDVRVVVVIEPHAGHAHVRRNRRGAPPDPLERPRHRGRQLNSPTIRYQLPDLRLHGCVFVHEYLLEQACVPRDVPPAIESDSDGNVRGQSELLILLERHSRRSSSAGPARALPPVRVAAATHPAR